MANDLNISGTHPSLVGVHSADSQSDQDVRNRLLKALKADDGEAFDTLLDHEEANLEDTFNDNKNWLYLAIESRSQRVALTITDCCYQYVAPDVVNGEDQHGYTPIMYAAQGDADNDVLIAALLRAGASVGLHRALLSAAERGHTSTAKLLIEAGVDVSAVLAEAASLGVDGAKAAKTLIALGANPSEALDHAVKRENGNAARILMCLGAKGSDALASAAERNDQGAMKLLLAAGANGSAAMTTLAKNPNSHAARTLLVEVAMIGTNWIVMAETGDVEAAKAYVGVNREIEEQTLKRLVENGNAAAARTMIAAGVDASGVLDSLAKSGRHKEAELLLAAGAQPTALTEDIAERLAQRIERISDMSPSDKVFALAIALLDSDMKHWCRPPRIRIRRL